jgi:hypothetical protein
VPGEAFGAGSKGAGRHQGFSAIKSYRPLDVQWVAAAERSSVIRALLRGVDNQDHSLIMQSHGLDDSGALTTTVRLGGRQPDGATRAAAAARIESLEKRIAAGGPNIAEAQRELRTLKDDTTPSRDLVSTTLKIAVGETVVVGTSRVQGDKALILLLTAVGR